MQYDAWRQAGCWSVLGRDSKPPRRTPAAADSIQTEDRGYAESVLFRLRANDNRPDPAQDDFSALVEYFEFGSNPSPIGTTPGESAL